MATLILDTKTNKLIGACMIGFINELPYILDFVVYPEFRRRGQGTKMIQRTLNLLYRNYSAIRLNVTVGNNAERFYNELGFLGLAEKA